MGEECLDILSNSTVHVDVYSIIEYYSIENDYSHIFMQLYKRNMHKNVPCKKQSSLLKGFSHVSHFNSSVFYFAFS